MFTSKLESQPSTARCINFEHFHREIKHDQSNFQFVQKSFYGDGSYP